MNANTFERWGETVLGAVVAAVAIGFFVFAAAQAGHGGASGASYDVVARFQRVDGVDVGSDVRVSGVKVGIVRAVELDPETYMARLTFSIDRNVAISDDSTARVSSDGLLGGAYVAIEPGAGEALPPGGEILYTQGAVDLLTLLASFARGQGNSDAAEAQTQ